MKTTVGMGFIGTGFARRVQIPAFLACDGAKLVSVSSGTIENARAAALEFGIGHFSNDWRETVNHPDVDLICVTTPPVHHKEMVLDALAAGKHVLAEKPMAMNAAEAEEMTRAAGQAGVLALIDHELRFLPGRLKAWSMLREMAIGKVRNARCTFRSPTRSDRSIPWDWWSDEDAGGGALGAIGSHVIDSFNWFLDTPISTVHCQLHTHVKERRYQGNSRPVTTDDEANMLLRFEDGELTDDATGLVSISMVEGPDYQHRMEFFGDRGALRVDHRGEVFIAKAGDADWNPIDVELPKGIDGLFESGFPSGFVAFAPRIVEAVRSGSGSIEHAATFEDGLKVQRVLDAARESDASGRAVTLESRVSANRG
ncbi:MAG: Gfo/Idh/MocA family oxidoreductase [Chloracidobacterium sp.]|nr:Gfo/Idh/MocA family oxidoreductase [Chloracidobacterium sp.]